MPDTQVDSTAVKSNGKTDSRWDSNDRSNHITTAESDRSNGIHPEPSSRSRKEGRPRGSKPRRVPRGPAQKDSGDEEESVQTDRGQNSIRNPKDTLGHQNRSLESSADPHESLSSQSEMSEDDEEDDDEDDDDDDGEDDQEEENGEEHEQIANKEEENVNGSDADKIKDETQESDPVPEQEEGIDTTPIKHNRVRNQVAEHQKEPHAKSNQKRQPYVRQVELPKERLSAVDLEAKMAAMALKNAQLMEQKKAADQDAAEYREIELKSQQAFEAQRDQQRQIDAVRKTAADRKLKKTQGREWDFQKSEDDWKRSRPYTDSMTNPNPGKNSWYSNRGPGYRGKSARGSQNSDRGMGRGGNRGGRGTSGWQREKTDVNPASHDPSPPTAVENESSFDQDYVPPGSTEWY